MKGKDWACVHASWPRYFSTLKVPVLSICLLITWIIFFLTSCFCCLCILHFNTLQPFLWYLVKIFWFCTSLFTLLTITFDVQRLPHFTQSYLPVVSVISGLLRVLWSRSWQKLFNFMWSNSSVAPLLTLVIAGMLWVVWSQCVLSSYPKRFQVSSLTSLIHLEGIGIHFWFSVYVYSFCANNICYRSYHSFWSIFWMPLAKFRLL